MNLPDAAGTKHELELSYYFTPAGTRDNRGTPGATFAVPLVVPEQVTQGETKVRVWAEPGSLPVPAGGSWAELNVEEVPGRQELPALVLRVQRVDMPLSLGLGSRSPAFTVLARRVLVQAEVGEAGGQAYRARFLLGQLAGRHLDVELPVPAAVAGLEVSLNGKRVAWSAVDEFGQASEGGRAARLELEPGPGPGVERAGGAPQLPPGRGGAGLLQTPLPPPGAARRPRRVPTRWQVTVPANWVTVGPEGGLGADLEPAWLAPGPAAGGDQRDLERWFLEDGRRKTEDERKTNDASLPSSVFVFRLPASRSSSRAWCAGRTGWTDCAAARASAGVAVALFAGAAAGGTPALCWPAAVRPEARVSRPNPRDGSGRRWPCWRWRLRSPGCCGRRRRRRRPTAANPALRFCCCSPWCSGGRTAYRRQIVFLPSFSRPGATPRWRRAGSVPQPHGEPSTVDAPPPVLDSSAGKLRRVEPEGSEGGSRSKVEDRV